tara:strand:- start:384 stop:734 length:351 start_codon:yes stop_codon:yes gene_type:complete
MSWGTIIYTWFFGHLVGKDKFGNKYFCNKSNSSDIMLKRWVIFSKEVEASRIPPEWHAWLHKTIDKPPLEYQHKYDWQKDHLHNPTGTSEAYFPNSHPLSKLKESKTKKEYETWKP